MQQKKEKKQFQVNKHNVSYPYQYSLLLTHMHQDFYIVKIFNAAVDCYRVWESKENMCVRFCCLWTWQVGLEDVEKFIAIWVD